jgi:hypothetical protein
MALRAGLRRGAKDALHHVFEWGQRFGVDILPRHYYSSIPDLRALKASDFWKCPRTMVGVAGTDIDTQVEFARACCNDSLRNYLQRTDVHGDACQANGAVGYGRIEADFLFAFVCTRRPKRIVQIGAGVSTAVILHAVREFDLKTNILCIDPYPTRSLRQLALENKIELIASGAQQVELERILDLSTGDLLFVDSTHTMRPDSEVNRLILEILPRLNHGCFVHFHDIFFPYDYQTSLLSEPFFSGESSLLHAFLTCNSRYQIAVSLSMLHYAAPERLQRILPNYRPAPMSHGLYRSGKLVGHFPSSTYLEVVN